ncbi:GNAT family N-acetyltransferase [Sagittula stellata]|uniref:Acetyltransferase (GNAT) family protein n=1 Tax=Sagittula stellata (strain ATCC 700073 / DSM 11524 / E-37) TaxID=388399 RepID=A3KA76_SAGS3|nr:GNAT family N-acetyltransferase [Sagittula stellata]EBA05867.1 Acetyltransferase (GNAT) family protein [Sagittula stellata E-37]
MTTRDLDAKAPCEKHRPGPAARNAARMGGRVPVIDTRRLQLRGPRIYDFETYAEILTSDRAIFMDGPYSREEAWSDFTNYIACWMLHGHGLWTIDAATQPTAGFVLLGYEWEDPEPELGIFLSAAAEGQGIALEALEAARDHAFNDLNWDSVASFVASDNDRANRLMKRSGARRDAEVEARIRETDLHVWRHRKEAA